MIKEKVKILFLFVIIFLPISSVAQPKDSEILYFLTAILSGQRDSVYLCKEFYNYPLDCGNGSGGYTENFYVFFIDKNERARFVNFFPSSGSGDISSQCGGSVSTSPVGFKELPKSMQDSLIVPTGKKMVAYKVTVTGGDGTLQIDANLECSDEG
ncbi:MAG: hypothetical protein GY707_02245 [Desulfobacteraceae bacterium]|nr:hypothetical protein [Desulfobacteraceae bacterium]